MKCASYGCDKVIYLPRGAYALAYTICTSCRLRLEKNIAAFKAEWPELHEALKDPKWDDDYGEGA